MSERRIVMWNNAKRAEIFGALFLFRYPGARLVAL